MEKICGSVYWDWNLTWYTDSPEFTSCFEATLFVIPCCFLIVFAVVDVVFSCQSSPPNTANFLVVTKFLFTALFLLNEFILFFYNYYILYNIQQSEVQVITGEVDSVVVNPIDVYIPAIKIISFIVAIALQILHFKTGVRSSAILFLFWLLLALVQTVDFRTRVRQGISEENWVQQTFHTVHIITFPLTLVQFILHCWADSNKSLRDAPLTVRPPCPEQYASFLSRLCFSWFDSFAITGFKRPIKFEDIWLPNPKDLPEVVYAKFEKYWQQATARKRQRNCSSRSDNVESNAETLSTQLLPNTENDDVGNKLSVSVFPSIVKTLFPLYVTATCMRFLPDALAFVSPQIIRLLINHISSDEQQWKGYLYAVVLVAVASFQVVAFNQSIHGVMATSVHVRSILISAIYKKALRLPRASKSNFSAGEIMNILSVDVEKIVDLFPYINVTWVAPFQLVICTYFLWTILGPSVLAGVGVMLLLIPINSFIVPKIRGHVLKQLEYKSLRAKKINEIVTSIKILKLQGWENTFGEQVKAIRQKEILELKKIAFCTTCSTFLEICAPYFVTLSTFTCYVLTNENATLDAQKMFVSLAFFNAMFEPLAWMPIGISRYFQASVSFKRIDKFMNADELQADAVCHDDTEDYRILVENGTFAWNDTTVLTGINLRIKEGSLIAIVGPVGCGKTSILNAILGEMNKLNGRVNTHGSISFVAQQAWIPNGTVKDNILFGGAYNEDKFERVIDACALRQDLNILQGAEFTEVGEKGVTLSGGQKSRLSLATAAYRDADIILLDDCLSALDGYVEQHIFDNVIGPSGLLSGKTRVMTTNSITHLSQFDCIIVMKDGCITETGTYQELLDNNGAFAEFLSAFSPPETEKLVDSERKKPAKVNAGQRTSEKQRWHSLSSQSSAYNYIEDQEQDLTDSEESNSKSKQDKAQLIFDERTETKSVSWSVYLEYLRHAGWKLVFGTFIFFFLHQVFSVGGNLCLSVWSNESAGNKTITPARRNMYLEIYAGYGLCQAIAIFLANLCMNFGSLSSAVVLHSKMLSRVLHAPMYFFETTLVGRIINRFSKDVDTADNYLPLNIRWWIITLYRTIAIVFVVSYSTPIFVVVLVPIFIIFYFIQRFFIASSRQIKRLEALSRSPIYAHISETISGASIIRAYGDVNRYVLESATKIERNQSCQYAVNVANRWLSIRLEIVAFFIIFFAAIFSIVEKDRLTPGFVGLSLTYAIQISFSLKVLVRYACDLANNFIAVERVKEYLEIPQEAPWEVTGSLLSDSWPPEGNVDFNQYETRYREGLDLVLKNITASIKSGEKIGLVGRTGSGKSSLTLALFRIIEAASGSIHIDGQDISELGLHDIRKRLTIIPQDPCLFEGTIRFNLDPFDSFDDDQVWHALELSNLSTFVQSLPHGLHYPLSEGGENLSVGQRQLMCLARALMRKTKTKILVLDEATAAVDLEAEETIRQTIRSEFNDCTILTIAHRLNNVMDCDRVMVIDTGAVIEFDSPQNLLQNPSSIFYGMAQSAHMI